MPGSRRLLGLMASCCVPAVLALAAPTSASTYPTDRLVNSGAESGLTGWQGAGFVMTSYDDEAISRRTDRQTGTYLFSAAAEAVIWQIVDFSALASTIDSGRQELSGGGLLGGREGQAGGARLVIQSLDGAGAAIGEPQVIGNPSDRDREFKTKLLDCVAHRITVPVGMRAVLVRLEAVGHGLADELYLLPEYIAIPAIAPWPPFRPADGPGCHTEERLPVPAAPTATPPAPKLTELVRIPAANRCGRRDPLRFRVNRRWRSQVASLHIVARGKRIVRTASTPITIAAPLRILSVGISVKLRNGPVQTSTMRFSGCRR